MAIDPPKGSVIASEAHDEPAYSARDMAFVLEVLSAILGTLDIDQILYVVLSGATSGEGLGFNRGLFALVDEGDRTLRTRLAVGPLDGEEAHRIWEDMKAKDLTLAALLRAYDTVKDHPAAHRLTRRLGHLHLPLSDIDRLAARSIPPQTSGQAPLVEMLARCLVSRAPVASSTLELVCDEDGDPEPLRLRNWCMLPLLTPDRIVGVLVVDSAYSERPLTAATRHLLVALGNLTAIAVEKGRLFDRMRALAEVDGLTGVGNRRTYDAALRRTATEARQTGRALSLVIVDVDHFKAFNDGFGHLAGDDVLRRVASCLSANARRTDVIARYGGDEFVVLLPDTPAEVALGVARKLVDAVRQAGIGNDCGVRVTVSAGVASSTPTALDEVALFDAADRAVFEAKRLGRDREHAAPTEPLLTSPPR